MNQRLILRMAIVAIACSLALGGVAEPDKPASIDRPPADAAADGQVAKLLTQYSWKQLSGGVYVGSEFCLSCHPSYSNWRDTRHAQALRRPMTQFSLIPGKGVVADYDKNGVDDFRQGLDFNAISSAFNRYKPNAPILSVEGGVYYITIGQLRMPVISTHGGTGEWRQQYLVRVPVANTADGLSASNYVSPVQYNEKTRSYVAYRPERWWDAASRAPLYGPGTSASALAATGLSHSQSCAGCHTTGIQSVSRDNNGEWIYRPFPAPLVNPNDPAYLDYDHDGNPDIVNVGCESCHGPGSRHILSGGDPSRIVNPSDLRTAEANEVCGQCHVRGKSVPNGHHDWPYKESSGTQFVPGGSLALTRFFSDNSFRWPDGINSRGNQQQWLDFIESPKPGFQFHPVKCTECHDAHGDTSNDRLIRDRLIEDGIRIRTEVGNNTLCLACHATHGPFEDINPQTVADIDREANRDHIADVVADHANHPYGPERRMGLGNCVECHMPKIAKSAIEYDIRSHTFEAIPPEKTLAYQSQGGMPSSCAASCHSLKVNTFGFGLDPNISRWNQSFDRRTALQLERYFGPGGNWWNTADQSSVTYENLELAAEPGEVEPASEIEHDE